MLIFRTSFLRLSPMSTIKSLNYQNARYALLVHTIAINVGRLKKLDTNQMPEKSAADQTAPVRS